MLLKSVPQLELAVVVPDYTKDDFLTTKPYEWLYAQKSNSFLSKIAENMLKEKAADLGIRNFITLYNSFVKDQCRNVRSVTENVTCVDDQKKEFKSGKYICNDDGVKLILPTGDETQICAHPIMPIMRQINIETNEEWLQIAYKKGGKWRNPISVEKSAIASSQKILDLASFGVSVTSENAKALGAYLLNIEEYNYEEIDEVKSVSHLGWVGDNGFAPYIDDVVFDGEANFKALYGAVRSSGSREKWLDAMRKLRSEKTVARIFLAASFASVLLEPLGLLPFFVHLWGGSGTGKTVALMVAASVWASPRMGEYIGTFNSTDVGQEMTASVLRSLPYCIDEMQIQASAGQKDFDKMIYKLSQGVGRTRGAKTGGIKRTATWINCFLTTGEDPIITSSSMSGAAVRVLEIESVEKLHSDLVGLCDTIKENYGHAGADFVTHIQKDENVKKALDLQKTFFRQIVEIAGTDKQAASMSAILAADQIATELIFKDGNALTVEDVMPYITEKDDANANMRALEYIYDYVGMNRNKFIPTLSGQPTEIVGTLTKTEIRIIKSAFDRILQLAGFNPKSFLSWAERQKNSNGNSLLCGESSGRPTKKARVGDQICRCVCLFSGFICAQSDFEQVDEITPFDKKGD